MADAVPIPGPTSGTRLPLLRGKTAGPGRNRSGHADSPIWQRSGTLRKTHPSPRHRFCPAATGWSGGCAKRVTSGRPWSSPECPAAAVRSAPTGQFSRGTTTSRPPIPNLAKQWHPIEKRRSDPAGCDRRDPPEGLVDVRKGARMAGGGVLPDGQRHGLPGVRGQGHCSRRERPADALFPEHRQGVARREATRTLTPDNRIPLQQPEGLVDLRTGPCLSGGGGGPDHARRRLSLLRGTESAAGASMTWPPWIPKPPHSGIRRSTAI